MTEFIFGCLAGWIAHICWAFLIVPVYRNARKAQEKGQPAPVQEPVAWEQFYPDIGKPQIAYLPPTPSPDNACYTTPPAAQRQWVGLTVEEKVLILLFDAEGRVLDYEDYANAIEAKLKEQNT
jgi:hypothetical protein